MPLPIGLGFLMLPMALPRASFLVLPMALPRAIGFSSSGGRLGQYENNNRNPQSVEVSFFPAIFSRNFPIRIDEASWFFKGSH